MSRPLANFTCEARFRALTDAVQHCNLCPRMEGRVKVLSTSNGNMGSRVLFIGEAPGRLGADRTGVPLSGDRAGDNFDMLLANIGWTRKDVFATNAVLCNPRDGNGNNDAPSEDEIANCSAFLRMTVELLNPDVVVTLGTVALRAVAHIQPHTYSLSKAVRELLPWNGRWLMPMYHPGQRAMVHRSLPSQRADYFSLSKVVDPVKGLRRRRRRPYSTRVVAGPDDLSKMAHVIMFLIGRLGRASKFKLTKLLYLVDLMGSQSLGRQVTGSLYLRQADGPWPPEIDRALRQLGGYECITSLRAGMPVVSAGPSPRFDPLLEEEECAVVLEALARYGHMTNSEIKAAAYLTAPMRDLLRREKAGESTLNRAIEWGNPPYWGQGPRG